MLLRFYKLVFLTTFELNSLLSFLTILLKSIVGLQFLGMVLVGDLDLILFRLTVMPRFASSSGTYAPSSAKSGSSVVCFETFKFYAISILDAISDMFE